MDSGAPENIPVTIRTATAFWLVSAAAGILPVILEAAGINYGQSTPAWAVPYLVVSAVPVAALQVWAALELLRGARWSRVLLTVVAALSAIVTPLHLSGLILAGLSLTLAGAVLMWLPATSPFFRQDSPG
ncbi:hypothetical protein J2809_003296 [Arthrobacter pascens]|uniref:hypothetical protein n=1 Tax=Arthrobacter pascens TaxID=1677 RepID=UPI002862E1AA|nr:hypothetical protein [Arthrobacter pascens]MDR6558926.1 hypothetical protein [Arthrobacter pascens]